jgi:uncharacterized membrane protein
MTTKTTTILSLALIALAVIAGATLYPQLPDQIASHWNASGDADRYSGKFWGIFLLPLITAGLFIIFWLIPKIDPLKKNIEAFRGYYNQFWLTMIIFMLYIYALQLSWNLGYRFNFGKAILPGMSLLFFVIGGLLSHAKRNWFVGIRTPWTLSNDQVWEKTHLLGGKLFKLAAISSLIGLFLQGEAVFFALIIPILAASLIATAYSLYLHQKLQLT